MSEQNPQNIKVGDVVTHIDGNFTDHVTVKELEWFGTFQRARFEEGGTWLLDRLVRIET